MSNVVTRATTLAAAAILATTGASVGAAQASALPSAPTCHVADLNLSLGEPDGAAGSLYYPILFTNTSTHTCALRGYPGVSVVDVRHHQIGTSAIRTGEPVDTVSVSPGDTVTAVFRTNSRGVVPSCRPVSAYVKVYPPNSFQAVQIPSHLRLCGAFEISPVQASDNS
ncbi:hypothetical protein GCM10010347_41750 [Streptomyces cirratus]|uniref:DUF4232 domain-containing protein n=1 Tax=Streptomyces cirratus TaxID=68187 RepID=A0ABQ3EWC7_9ACTN|nr:DUF4232 domain-containing protein [Streptomyces cirratus]GHB67311.1 hypothetical protein GCM10010347_41750 [Streptomyces cirratus]